MVRGMHIRLLQKSWDGASRRAGMDWSLVVLLSVRWAWSPMLLWQKAAK